MARPENQKWNMDEIAEAFEGTFLPEDVAAIMTRYAERKQEENQENERMVHALRIIIAHDSAIRSEMEGGVVKSDYITDAAGIYLFSQRNKEVVDELDRKIRLASLYTLAVFELPYENYDETDYFKYLPEHPIDESEIRTMLKQHVVEKYGTDAWLPRFDMLGFDELFDSENMTYFDGESIGDVLSKQAIFADIKQQLTYQGFSLDTIETGE